jgi:hypothetical protein
LQFGIDRARQLEFEVAGARPDIGHLMPWRARRPRVRPALSTARAIAWRRSSQPRNRSYNRAAPRARPLLCVATRAPPAS